jgi:hypothetical protein
MLNAEKKCRRIKSGRIPFSPEAALWIWRTQVYRSLIRYHDGLMQNRGNLKRTLEAMWHREMLQTHSQGYTASVEGVYPTVRPLLEEWQTLLMQAPQRLPARA